MSAFSRPEAIVGVNEMIGSGKTGKRILIWSLVFCLTAGLTGCGTGKKETEEEITAEEYDYQLFSEMHPEDTYLLTPYASQEALCVTAGDVAYGSYEPEGMYVASGLFDLNNQKVIQGTNLFRPMYPASTTKIMTAYVALKYGNLDDMITVSESAMDIDEDSSVCGLKVGDVISLKDLLYGLMLASGNDAANVIAEHVGGSIPEFVNMMNREAQNLLMSGTHYENAHGLHQEEHYTTVYDLYLIFNECIKNETFARIIDTPAYTTTLYSEDGTENKLMWEATNYYFQEIVDLPANMTVLGGKTGTTDEAGACLVLLSRDSAGNPYISIILRAYSKPYLYEKMTELLELVS